MSKEYPTRTLFLTHFLILKSIYLLCCPVLNPQITGDPDRPWEATLNESLVQSPIALANENEILIFKKKFT